MRFSTDCPIGHNGVGKLHLKVQLYFLKVLQEAEADSMRARERRRENCMMACLIVIFEKEYLVLGTSRWVLYDI